MVSKTGKMGIRSRGGGEGTCFFLKFFLFKRVGAVSNEVFRLKNNSLLGIGFFGEGELVFWLVLK